MSSLIGHARVSTDARFAIQEAALRALDDRDPFREKDGPAATERTELETVLSFLALAIPWPVTRIDRLARSLLDSEGIVRELRDKDVHLKALEQPVIRLRQPERPSSRCWGLSENLRPRYVGSARWRV